jgi:ATP-dependent DNA helicase RecG
MWKKIINNMKQANMESQTLEWKETWHDEYLKWICGFANTQGGTLEIGKDDCGSIVGITGAHKLLEDLPNKIRNGMGIIADVNLVKENGLYYISIKINAYPYPISYHGKYYYRSGNTTQELTGNALDEFMLRKQGKTWDSVPMPHVTVDDLDIAAFRVFRKKALESGRLTEFDLAIDDKTLLKNLRLVENNYLKRAAILLFHEDPEQWVMGAYVKIGYFRNGTDLLYQDEIHGPLVSMPDKVMEALLLKYFKAYISYRGIQRIETYPIPQDAVREAVLNAVVHKDYSTYNPIHIRVYDDKTLISNDGRFPEEITSENLLTARISKPFNPTIANAFFRCGLIEAWGRGIERINNSCINAGLQQPVYRTIGNVVMLEFEPLKNLHENIDVSIRINKTQQQIIRLMGKNPKITAREIAEKINIYIRNIENNIKVLKELGLIERIGSKKTGYWKIIYNNVLENDTVNNDGINDGINPDYP